MDGSDPIRGVYIESPAKINLHLEILGTRSDGYHEIDSIFQLVSLYDGIWIRSLKESDVLTIGDGQIIEDGLYIEGMSYIPKNENIICKAVDVFRRETGIDTGLSIQVRKTIPMGAGLGGGSGNAASVLIGLDRMFSTRLSRKEISGLGARLGSDVPFFCEAACARVRGRGEFIEAIPGRTDYSVVLIYPGFSVSTREAFGLYDRAENHDGTADLDAGDMYLHMPPSRWGFFNSFYRVLADSDPRFEAFRARLLSCGAVFSSVSGSGSALFGIFDDSALASRAWEQLRIEGFSVWNVKPLDSGITAILQ